MRYRVGVLLLLMLAVMPAARGQDGQTTPSVSKEPLTLTCEQAIDTALQHNHQIIIARAETRLARGAVDEARASGNPTLALGATYIRFDKVTVVQIGPDQSIATGVLNELTSNAAINYPVDVSGLIRTAKSAAYLSYLASTFDLQTQEETVRLQVAQAFYGALKAKHFADVASEAVDAANEQLRVAQVNLDQGTAARFDVLRAEVQVADAKSKLIEAQNGRDLAMAALNLVLAIPIEQPVSLVDEQITVAAAVPPVAESADLAAKQRSEVLAAQVNLEAAHKSIKLARASKLPMVGLNWTGTFAPDATLFSPRKFSWQAAANISIPILDGGKAHAKVEEAQAREDVAAEAAKLTEESVRLDVRTAVTNLEGARDRYNVAVKSLESAKESYRLAQLRFEQGVSTSLEVMDASVARSGAETNLYAASYDYRIAQAAFARAIGKPAGAEGAAK